MDTRIDIAGHSVSPDHYIGGRRVASPETFETRCPFNWSWKLADVARGDAGRRSLPMSPEELLEAAVLIYLRGLGIESAAKKT